MAQEQNPAPLVEKLKDVAEVGGPKEVSALTTELNQMSWQQLQQLSNIMPYFNQMEHAKDPTLPALYIGGHGAGRADGSYEMTGFSLDKVDAKGAETTLYNRDFVKENGVTSDVKYESGTDKVASKTVMAADAIPPMLK